MNSNVIFNFWFSIKDPYYFNEQVEEDFRNGYVPMALIANVGSHDIGQCDELQQLNDICVKYRMWLHLEGVHLATLALYSVPTAVQVFFVNI